VVNHVAGANDGGVKLQTLLHGPRGIWSGYADGEGSTFQQIMPEGYQTQKQTN